MIARLRTAGLRQRGGTGEVVADSWEAVLREAGGIESAGYVVCNAVDADPRAATVRRLLEHKARAVVEGILIAAHTVGAGTAVIWLNEGYDAERTLLEEAAAGLEGEVELSVREIAACLVVGEDTALIRAVENRQPLPYLRPAGTRAGVKGAPTLVESAETFAAVAEVCAAAAPCGDEAAVQPETKLVTVFGDGVDACTLDVPFGTTIAAVLEQAGGCPPAGLHVKAVQLGGPASRFLAGGLLETPIDPAELEKVGATIGSGALEVFGAGRCGVELARDVTARLHAESCGTCVFCREGTRQLVDILEDAAHFRASAEQMELLHELAEAMGPAGICSVGWGAGLPALSAMELFADDFRAHVEERRCVERTA